MKRRKFKFLVMLIVLLLVGLQPMGALADQASSVNETLSEMVDLPDLLGEEVIQEIETIRQSMEQLGASQREETGQARQEVRQQKLSEIQAQAAQIRQAATERLAQGIISGDVAQGVGISNLESLSSRRTPSSEILSIDRMTPTLEVPNRLNQEYANEIAQLMQMGTHLTLESEQLTAEVGPSEDREAMLKELEQQCERMRVQRDVLKDTDENLSQLIQKTLETLGAIQESMNQTRAAITMGNL